MNVERYVQPADGVVFIRRQRRKIRTLGGPGSGHHGHAGRPGEVGGSAPSGLFDRTLDVSKPALGIIGVQGDVQVLNSTEKFNDHDQLFGEKRFASQRFRYSNGRVKWDEKPDLDDYHAVEGFFAREGVTLKEQLYYDAGRWNLVVPDPRVLGGPGSGHFGHAGRPGEVGGSAPSEETRAALEKAITDQALEILKAKGLLTGEGLSPLRDGGPTHAAPAERGTVKEYVVKTLSKDLAARVPELTGTKYSGFTNSYRDVAEAAVQDRLDRWATTSGDSHVEAISMQQAIRDEFLLHDAAMDHMEYHSTDLAYYQTNQQEYDIDRAYNRTEYEHTQAWFKERGISEVTVYRGQSFASDPGLKVGSTQKVTMQPASSWTTDQSVAQSFADNHYMRGPSFVLAARVPVGKILSTAVTGRGCLKEAEVLMLGGKLSVNVVSRGGLID
ncbi:MAG TPA: hypothetical protein VM531_11155 [Sphingomicrobium sp.]|jgi:hypothetical protein|nr:hypothetical protein [Sphingomicrobium sp.]